MYRPSFDLSALPTRRRNAPWHDDQSTAFFLRTEFTNPISLDNVRPNPGLHAGLAMPMQLIRRADAITRPEFHALLRAWLRDTADEMIGPPDVPAWAGWVHVADGPARFALHAETRRAAVESYVELLDRRGDGLAWLLVEVEPGAKPVVMFGPDREQVDGFSLSPV
jgi:hypothetical protein